MHIRNTVAAYDTAQMCNWLLELRDFLAERAEATCTCSPTYEPDTNAWIHSDQCAVWMEDHAGIILTEAAKLIGRIDAQDGVLVP